MGMITILASIVLVAVNPVRQFAQARNSQRISNVNAILNAIGNRIAENRGVFRDDGTCDVTIPTTVTGIAKVGFDLRPCIVPTYISEIPYDPASGLNTCESTGCDGGSETYDTDYTIVQDAETGRITVCAPEAAEASIEGSESYCLTR